MRNKFMIVAILLMLLSSACAAQNSTNRPGEATSIPTGSTEESTATEAAGEAEMTPTGIAEGVAPAQGTVESGLTPTASAEGSTSTQESGGAVGIPQTGPGDAGLPDDIQEMITVLVEDGATVEVGDEVQQESVTAIGRILRINGEEVRVFTYPSAEELEMQVSELANQGDPESAPRYYRLGNMLVFYAGDSPGVRDLLENVVGAQEAAQ